MECKSPVNSNGWSSSSDHFTFSRVFKAWVDYTVVCEAFCHPTGSKIGDKSIKTEFPSPSLPQCSEDRSCGSEQYAMPKGQRDETSGILWEERECVRHDLFHFVKGTIAGYLDALVLCSNGHCFVLEAWLFSIVRRAALSLGSDAPSELRSKLPVPHFGSEVGVRMDAQARMRSEKMQEEGFVFIFYV